MIHLLILQSIKINRVNSANIDLVKETRKFINKFSNMIMDSQTLKNSPLHQG